MYNGSTEFNNLIEKPGGNALITRLKFSDFEISKFTKLEYYGGSNNSDDIAIGTTNMAYLDVSAITDKVIVNSEFLLESGMELSDGTIEYAPMGYFTVQKPDGDEDTVSFKAYDRMQKFEKPYFSALTYPTDSAKVLNELCTICGVELATPITNPITITDKLEGYTCREVLGYIAGIHGCFACFDRYGKLNLRWYSETPIEKQIGLIWSLTKSQSDYKVEKVTLAKDSETTYTSGDGIRGINHSNPYATQDIADSIYASLNGFTYRPCEISMLDDIRLDPWDMLKVIYLDGSVLTIPVMSLSHSLTNGETNVKSVGKSNTENEYSYSGPVTQAMDRMSTELLIANRVIATKVDAEWVLAHSITSEYADLKYATIINLNAEKSRIDELQANSLTANSAVIKALQTDKLNTSDLNAETAKLGYLTADSAVIKGKLDVNQLSAEVAKLGYLSAEQAEIGYAKIDFSNVGTQFVSSSMIIDGAVTNEKVANLSANKITSGTIDASKINVTNLNADNLTVGTINGQRIGKGSLSLDKLSEEVPTKEYLDSVEESLQNQIDGAIETFTKTEIPTLNNEPASLWTDNDTRKKHIGDICYVVNPASSADGYCYRFANLGSESNPSYSWVLIKDSDVTKALQDIIDINGEIAGIKQFDNEISSWKTDTDNELSSIKARTSTLETEMGTKVESTTFNTLKQTVDENSSNITSLSTTVSKKADSSTVTALTNTVNSVKQTVDTNTSSISSMQTEITKKADGSTVTALSTKVSNIEQDLSGFKTTVSSTYTTKTQSAEDLSTAKSYANTVGSNTLTSANTNTANLLKSYSTTTQMNSAIEQSATFIKQTVSATYTTKEEFNGLEIGGRNLLLNSKMNYLPSGTSGTIVYKELIDDDNYGTVLHVKCSYVHQSNFLKMSFIPVVGERYLITFFAKSLNSSTFTCIIHSGASSFSNYSNIKTSDKWQKCTGELTIRNIPEGIPNLYFYPSNDEYWIKDIKIEKGNKATDWTPAPEDTEASITAVETIATQTADKFNWLVKSGTSATDFTLTDRTATLISEYINLNGLVTFSGLSSDAVSEITDAIEVGGRNLLRFTDKLPITGDLNTGIKCFLAGYEGFVNTDDGAKLYFGGNGNISMLIPLANEGSIPNGQTVTLSFDYRGNITSFGTFYFMQKTGADVSNSGFPSLVVSETDWQHYEYTFSNDNSNARTCTSILMFHWLPSYGSDKWIEIKKGSLKLEKGNKVTDWTPAPEDISVENIYTANTTTIDGGKITTGSIKAKSIDIDDLFTKNITMDGTFETTSSSWIAPNATDCKRIEDIYWGHYTPTSEELKYYDFNNDGEIGPQDMVISGRLMYGTLTLQDIINRYGYEPQYSNVSLIIKPSDSDGLIRTIATNPLGRTIENRITATTIYYNSVQVSSIRSDSSDLGNVIAKSLAIDGCDIKSKLDSLISIQKVQIPVSGGKSTNISAPAIDGYSFKCWINVASSGFVGSPYIAVADNINATIWDNNYTTNKSLFYEAIALYVKN